MSVASLLLSAVARLTVPFAVAAVEAATPAASGPGAEPATEPPSATNFEAASETASEPATGPDSDPAPDPDPDPGARSGTAAGLPAPRSGPSTRGPRHEAELVLTSEALGTVHLGLGAPLSPLPRARLALDLPLTLWVTSGLPDTARLAGGAALRRDGRRLGLDLAADLRLGVQADSLGVRVGLDTSWRAGPALLLGPPGGARRPRLPLRLAVEQPLATLVTFSDYAREAFVDSGTDAPHAGVVPFGRGRVVAGAGIALPLPPVGELHGALDLAWAPGPMGLDAWQQLTVGQVPLRAEAGLRRWW